MTRIRKLRIATASLTILIIVSGAVGALAYGSVCSLDIFTLSVIDPMGFVLRAFGVWRATLTAICPLGFLERSLVVGELLPQWPGFLVIVLSVVMLGRVFCAWVCPSTLYRRVVRGNPGSPQTRQAAPKGVNWSSYSSYAVLGGVLLTSLLFRFPVWCFFCPVGLFFGSVYAVIRFFSPDTPGLELVLFPVMLAIELWGFKSWCRSICPLGALLSIIGAFNPFLRPTVNPEKCHAAKGINCQACAKVCPEGIDLASKRSFFAPNSCTKCLDCSTRCPVHAIKFPLLNLRSRAPLPATSDAASAPAE